MNKNHNWKDQFFYASVFLFALSLPFSEFMISLSAGLLLISCILTGRFQEKTARLKERPAVLLLISVFFVYVLGTLFTRDLKLALYELQKTAFILVVPLCLAIGPNINYSKFRKILIAYLIALNLASAIAIFRLIFRDFFGIDEIWKILFVSHIGFSLQLLLGIAIILNELYNKWHHLSRILKMALIADILYLAFFLFILKSLTGLVTFAVLMVIHLFFVAWKIKVKKIRTIALILLPLMILGGFFYLGSCIYRYYDVEKIDPAKLPERTQNGNLYHHDLNNKQLENGHYIGLYFCPEELEKAWEQRSQTGYNQLGPTGFPISTTLVRYLTSKGLPKDSAGVAKLSPEDIQHIENGIANHIYTQRFLSLYPRIYQTIWELDMYFKTGDPNLKSLAQRIEFVKAAITVIREHPFFGVGTGNYKQEFIEAYQKNQSKLDPQHYGSSHNQYLNYLVKFGILGFLWIMFAWIYPLFLANKQGFYPVVMLLLIMGIANFSDSNLEAHMGISFFIFFYSFFLFSETQETNP